MLLRASLEEVLATLCRSDFLRHRIESMSRGVRRRRSPIALSALSSSKSVRQNQRIGVRSRRVWRARWVRFAILPSIYIGYVRQANLHSSNAVSEVPGIAPMEEECTSSEFRCFRTDNWSIFLTPWVWVSFEANRTDELRVLSCCSCEWLMLDILHVVLVRFRLLIALDLKTLYPLWRTNSSNRSRSYSSFSYYLCFGPRPMLPLAALKASEFFGDASSYCLQCFTEDVLLG